MARDDAGQLFGQEHVRSYRDTDGELGHDWRGASTLLLTTTTGRRSGASRTTPLIYGRHGDAYVVVASKGGADEPPGWYANLLEHPEVEVQVLADRFRARARTASPRRSPSCGARWSGTGPTTRTTSGTRAARSRSSCSSASGRSPPREPRDGYG